MREDLRDSGRAAWFAVGRDTAALASIEAIAQPLGHPVHRLGSLDELADDGPHRPRANSLIVVIDPDSDAAVADALLAFLDGGAPAGTYVYVADELGGERYKRLLRSGRADWLSRSALATDLPELSRDRSALTRPPRQSRLWGVLPSKGGSGATTLAVETAFGLSERRSRRGARVAVVDLDLGGGTLADMLDVEPRLDIPDLLDHPDRLDTQLIDVFTSRFSPRLDVFACPQRWIDPRRLDPDILFALLDILAARYDDVLVDIPAGWHPWSDDLARGLDGTVVCGDDTVPGVRQLKAALFRLADLGVRGDRIAVAINRCETDLFGRAVRRAELERALPGQRLAWIRNDAVTVAHAQNSGQPVAQAAASSRVGRDLRVVVDWIESVTTGAAASLPEPVDA